MANELSLGAILRRCRFAVDPGAPRLGDYRRLPVRVGRAVTQEEVAEAVGVSRTWYALLEADAARASGALANRLADAFSLDAADRLALIRTAVPDLSVALSHIDANPNVDILLSPPPGNGLAIGTPGAIEETALRLARLRESFLSTGTIVPGARRRILNSWLRSRDVVDANRKIAPLIFARDAQLAEARSANERLLRAAEPVLAFLEERLAGDGYVVVLTDGAGRILELRGDREVRRHLERLEFVVGGDWSEAAAGTNAIGTALTDGRPLQLMAAEHFCEGWQHLTCTAAPIRDPLSQTIVGALDITGGYRLIRSHLLAMIMRCALDIEEALEPATSYV